MPITNTQSGTRIDEVGAGLFRVHTPVRDMPGGFSFNQYLVVDEETLVFHTGPRRMFPLVREAIAHVVPVDELRWIAFSHVESDECGGLNEFLAAAPRAQPLCSQIAALVSMNDLADRAPRGMVDGETIAIGKRTLTWLDAPHLPHAWECGYLADVQNQTLFCGDLFTQPGADSDPLTEGDILAPSEAFRSAMGYYSHTKRAAELIEKLAATWASHQSVGREIEVILAGTAETRGATMGGRAKAAPTGAATTEATTRPATSLGFQMPRGAT